MKITQNVIKPDGTETLQDTEVPDDFFTVPTAAPTQERADIDYLAAMAGVSL